MSRRIRTSLTFFLYFFLLTDLNRIPDLDNSSYEFFYTLETVYKM